MHKHALWCHKRNTTHTLHKKKSPTFCCTSLLRPPPNTHVHSHSVGVPKPWHPGPCYNYKADEHMATKRSQEGSGATKVMISGTKKQTWENRSRSQARGHATPRGWPWRTFLNARDHLASSLSLVRSSCLHVCLWFCLWVQTCEQLCVCERERVAFKGRRVLGGGKP